MAFRTSMTGRHLPAAVVSGIACALAFVIQYYFGWLILCYCVPILLILNRENDIPGYELFFGAVVFWSIHSWAIGRFCFAQWPLYGMIFFICFVLYLSTSRYVIVNTVMHGGRRLCKSGNSLFFIVGEILFWYFVSYHSFFIFGNNTGYCCAHPALPLIDTIGFNYAVSYFGTRGTLICIVMCNWLLATVFKKGYIKTLMIVSAVLLIAVMKVHDDFRESSYAWIRPPEERYVFDWAAEVGSALLQLHKIQYDHVTTIIMPESAFPFANADISSVMIALNQTDILKYRTFICGAYRNDSTGEVVNSLFYVNNEPLIHYYDKKTLFPFTEFLPWQWLSSIRAECGFGKTNICRPYDVLQDNSFTYDLFICSDLFFETRLLYARSLLKNDTVIFISNDSWCNFDYFKDLMNRYARLFAVSHSTRLCYVSHSLGYEYGFLYGKKIHDLN